MPTICPKCAHVRPADAGNPDWQCPACGVCYAKAASRPAPRRQDEPVEVKQGWDLATPAKILLVVVLGWGLNQFLRPEPPAPLEPPPEEEVVVRERPQPSGAGVAVLNTALQASALDSAVLHRLPERLERGCAERRNKYGHSEAECVARVRAHGRDCADEMGRRYPGRIGDAARMDTIVRAYADCVFLDGP